MKIFLILLYNIFVLAALIVSFPFLLIFLSIQEIKERLAIYSKTIPKDTIWVHCASVGEVNAALPLLKRIKKEFPDFDLLVTTMTVTGKKIVADSGLADYAVLLPFDFIPFFEKLIKQFKPKALIIVETELWFSMLFTMQNKNNPIMIVNGRMSGKSFKSYKLIRLMGLFEKISFTGTQSDEDYKRYRKLGFGNVHNTGNLKFAISLPDYDREKIRKEWLFKEDDFILVWGSSRPGEEELLKSIITELKIPCLKIIVAPRHLNRLRGIAKIFPKHTLLSQLKRETDILIIDSMGVLSQAYAIADIAIVGGSFFDFGGHNPIEPLYYSTATIIGNYHSSCRDLVEKLKDGIIVSDAKRLAADINTLASEKYLRQLVGQTGFNIIKENKESLEHNIDYIHQVMAMIKLDL